MGGHYMKINIVIPVLNEELRIEKGINEAIKYLDQNLYNNYMITIVDNGSVDMTEKIAKQLVSEHQNIDYIKLEQRGVGLALREAVKVNNCEIIGYMDVDLSTDLRHIKEMYELFLDNSKTVIVNGSRLLHHSNVTNRTIKREITSRGLNFILRVLLDVKFTDAMCGFKFFRKSTIEDLIRQSSENHGWFYCTELLVRAEWKGFNITEIPVVWKDDLNSKVKIIKLSINYMKEILKLCKEKRRSRAT